MLATLLTCALLSSNPDLEHAPPLARLVDDEVPAYLELRDGTDLMRRLLRSELYRRIRSRPEWREALESGSLGRLKSGVGLLAEQVVDVREVPLTKHYVYIANECFLTGTAAEVIPVVMVDSRRIGDGKPGPLTRDLIERFHKLTRS